MRLSQRHFQAGAIRIEYVVAAAICIALLAGMSAVLVRYSSSRSPLPGRPQVTYQQEPAAPPTPQEPAPQQPPQPTQAAPRPAAQTPPPVAVNPAPAPVAHTPAPSSAKGYLGGAPKEILAAGITRIEAENYDLGGEGISYHDTTPGNTGTTFRTSESVDLASSRDTEGGRAVTATQAGEWLNYSIRVPKSGRYLVRLRAACSPGPAKMRISLNGKIKGTLTIVDTGGGEKFVTTERGTVDVVAGEQILRLEMLSEGLSLDWIEFDAQAPAVAAAPVPTAQPSQPAQPNQPAQPSQPVQPVQQGNYLFTEDFNQIPAGQRPPGSNWTTSATGSVSVQDVSGERCLRLVDASRVGDCQVRQGFDAQKGTIVWRGRVRFLAAFEGFGIGLVEGDKPAVILYTRAGEIGYEDNNGKWQRLARFEANAWYDLRIEADVKDQSCSLFIDSSAVGGTKIKFRNQVKEINGWMAGTSPPLTSTMLIDNVSVEVR